MFLFFSLSLQAQDDYKRLAHELPFFIDADVGVFLYPDYSPVGFTHASFSAGYRFNANRAIGLEYRGAKFEDASNYDESGRGIGLVYRSTRNSGVYTRTSLGVVLSSKRTVYESAVKYDAEGLGSYYSLTFGYQFRSGVLLGITGSGFTGRNFRKSRLILAPEYADSGNFPFFDVRNAPADAGVFVPDGEERTNFYTFTLTVGYAFPGRERKWR